MGEVSADQHPWHNVLVDVGIGLGVLAFLALLYAILLWLAHGHNVRRHSNGETASPGFQFSAPTGTDFTLTAGSGPQPLIPANTPPPTPAEISSRHIKGKTLRLTELEMIGGLLVKMTFEDCHIDGPAIVVPTGGTSFQGCHIAYSATLESILWPFPSSQVVVGAIGLVDCEFKRCWIDGIGFAGPPDALDNLRKQIPPGDTGSQ